VSDSEALWLIGWASFVAGVVGFHVYRAARANARMASKLMDQGWHMVGCPMTRGPIMAPPRQEKA
jgi:hypothetical protein